ncbi:MAG: hypothetical protein FD167_79 [bacterium]|nr:MAG: hypothetical protein FD167_79 [bacterium]
MAVRFHKLSRKPKLFRSLTTLSVEEFVILVKKLQPLWKKSEHSRKLIRTDRKNKPGQGHPYFADFQTLLLLIVLYLKSNTSNALLGLLFGIEEQAVYDISAKLLPILHGHFMPQTMISKRKPRGTITTVDQLLEQYPDLKEVIADGTDIQTRRPKRRQAKNYSGKSKKHSKKSVLIINPKDGLILGRTKLRPGSIHDKRLLEEDGFYGRMNRFPDLMKRADSAWTGEDGSNGWLVNKRAVRNHPLTEADKKQNRVLSKVRIGVEHAIRRVKVFLRIGSKTSFRVKGKLDSVLDAIINLANFKQLMRHPVQA